MWQENKLKWIAAGSAAIGISYIAYRLYKKHNPPEKPNKRKQSIEQGEDGRMPTIHSHYSEFYFDKQEQLRLVMAKITGNGPTIQQIYLLSPMIIVDEYSKYTKEIRKRRRLIRKVNQNQYVNLIRTYELEIGELLQRGRQQVLEEYGLSLDDLAKMQAAYEMFEDPQALRKNALIELKKLAYKSQKLRKIPREKLKRIIEQEIGFISGKMFQRLKLKLQEGDTGMTQDEIHRVITTLCDDIIFEKYGYERQEIENQLDEIPLLTKDLLKQRQILFANLVEFNIDSLESPQNSDEQSNNSGGNQISIKTNKTRIVDSGQFGINEV